MFYVHLAQSLQNTNLLQSILNTIKVPKRDIFVAEFFYEPIWVGDLRIEAKNQFLYKAEGCYLPFCFLSAD
jgi:hypothetical protein